MVSLMAVGKPPSTGDRRWGKEDFQGLEREGRDPEEREGLLLRGRRAAPDG